MIFLYTVCGFTLKNLQHRTHSHEILFHLKTLATVSLGKSLCLCSLYCPVFWFYPENHRITGSSTIHWNSAPILVSLLLFTCLCFSPAPCSNFHLRLECLIDGDGILTEFCKIFCLFSKCLLE